MRSAWPVLASVIAGISVSASTWAACSPPAAVRFPPGASATMLSGGLPRGERDCYTLGARSGQTLSVTQPHPTDSNIVLQLYQPPWHVAMTADGLVVNGKPLPGAAEGQDAPRWTGTLPLTGTYLLVLGTSRGGGEYQVRVEIH